jgi:ATP synthase assembly factor FMC1
MIKFIGPSSRVPSLTNFSPQHLRGEHVGLYHSTYNHTCTIAEPVPAEYPFESRRDTMAQSAPQVRSLYRRILRELPIPQATIPSRTTHQKLSTPSTLQQRIRESVSKPSTTNTQSQIQQAEQFAQYIQAQRTYLALIERYNPGMGMSEEERVRLSARRVGMDLPEEFVREPGWMPEEK